MSMFVKRKRVAATRSQSFRELYRRYISPCKLMHDFQGRPLRPGRIAIRHSNSPNAPRLCGRKVSSRLRADWGKASENFAKKERAERCELQQDQRL